MVPPSGTSCWAATIPTVFRSNLTSQAPQSVAYAVATTKTGPAPAPPQPAPGAVSGPPGLPVAGIVGIVLSVLAAAVGVGACLWYRASKRGAAEGQYSTFEMPPVGAAAEADSESVSGGEPASAAGEASGSSGGGGILSQLRSIVKVRGPGRDRCRAVPSFLALPRISSPPVQTPAAGAGGAGGRGGGGGGGGLLGNGFSELDDKVSSYM